MDEGAASVNPRNLLTTLPGVAGKRISRTDVVRHRFHAHQLDRAPRSASSATAVDVLDYGVQDTGNDGAAWALANRGAPAARPKDLALAWTLRGAPHAYRRADLADVAVATAPFGEADAAKRIYDAARPLKAAKIPVLDALTEVADHMRAIATKPTAKGEMSGRLTTALGPEYLRFCRPCNATHIFEMPFRLAALQAGLELEAHTSPPVLRRVTGMKAPHYGHLADDASPQFDVIRNYLRFFGPGSARHVAAFVEAPLKDIQAHWPSDAVEVWLAGGSKEPCFVLGNLATPAASPRVVRLLGPFDPYLQLRDRELLVSGEAERKDLWRTLGRPGAIVADGEILGTWRPKTSGRKLTVILNPWSPLKPKDRALVKEQAERLADHRQATLTAVTEP